MAPLQGLTADAGQVFEVVSALEACQALHGILQAARRDGLQTVTVAADKHAFFGGCVFRSLRKCRVFQLADLYSVFAASCLMKYAPTGNKIGFA